MNRNISVIKDADGNSIVVINDIIFKGRQSIDWDDVKRYLYNYVDDFYRIAESGDLIYIGKDFPDEYTGSKDTYKLKGTLAKAKANAAQGIPEMVEVATGKSYRENNGEKHRNSARYGWDKFNSFFALPVYDNSGGLERYNVFHASLLFRHGNDNKVHLYDIIDIKKKRVTL